MDLLAEITLWLRRSGLSPSRFGREAVHDPRFVHDLKLGRSPGPRISARARAFMASREVAR